MRQVTRKGLITMAAAGGVLALSGGYAHADAGAAGGASNSPGVLSGNSVQIPVDVPVNVCGNSVSVVGLLNPAAGNTCGNGSQSAASDRHASRSQESDDRAQAHRAGTGRHRAVTSDTRSGATAEGVTSGSPGVLSGNNIAVPIDIPVNACGNSVTIGGLLNPASGNDCGNVPDVVTPPVGTPVTPVTPVTENQPPAPGPRNVSNAHETQNVAQLAHTGAGGLDLLVPASVGLLLAGAGTVLYRRARMSA
ncbi:chaplin [Streptomyces sp. Ncost-T10-10d]|uniref:chaplin n=1 Tax=Streptomyces sp. Ncost-T10-10d TaxID=1839774 RepID=UPI00081EE703|nr:chaplin [Streptomyces sp. Ncost-T10-10d]SCF58462.1 Small secreted domain [Streptomyces sp. Ncost-T10-10d]